MALPASNLVGLFRADSNGLRRLVRLKKSSITALSAADPILCNAARKFIPSWVLALLRRTCSVRGGASYKGDSVPPCLLGGLEVFVFLVPWVSPSSFFFSEPPAIACPAPANSPPEMPPSVAPAATASGTPSIKGVTLPM